jgi:predicted murein hydrolase (TIGR00659 family)
MIKEFLQNPAWLLALTCTLFFCTGILQKKVKSPLLSPILITTAVLIGYLLIFNISYEQYEKAGKFIDFWLQPSVVALAVPLYLQIEKIKKQLIPILVSQFAGSLIGIISVCGIAMLLGADKTIIASLAPKSVTTPIALEVSKTIGGNQALTASAVIITGILGSVIGLEILKYSKIKSPMGQGICLGTASHGLGIMKAMELGEKHAAFASVGLIMNGIFTAILAPIVVDLLIIWV